MTVIKSVSLHGDNKYINNLIVESICDLKLFINQ
jgi:hypothetical protein